MGGLIKIILFLVALGYGAQYVKENYIDGAADPGGKGGFVPVPPSEGTRPDVVTIVTAPGASDDAVARANNMATALMNQGIPVRRARQVSFSGGPDSVDAARAVLLLSGEQPVVMVRGRAKQNPKLDEVLVEYRSRQ